MCNAGISLYLRDQIQLGKVMALNPPFAAYGRWNEALSKSKLTRERERTASIFYGHIPSLNAFFRISAVNMQGQAENKQTLLSDIDDTLAPL
jgi:hypothetical protein